MAELSDELDANPSDEPLPLPELDEPDGPDTPDDELDGPAASGPISKTEQSTSPHVSERAGGVQIVATTPVRMAIVIVDPPTKRALFICTPCWTIDGPIPIRPPLEGGCHAARW